MASSDLDDRLNRASMFVKRFPRSAAVFLAKQYKTNEIEDLIKSACHEHDMDYSSTFHHRSGSSNSDTTSNSRPVISPAMGAVPENLPFSTPKSRMPLSPPTTHGSEASQSQSAANQMILAYDADLNEKKVFMTRAHVQYNWIKPSIAHDRLRLTSHECEGVDSVSTRYADSPNGMLFATHWVSVTWRRSPKSAETEEMRCYISCDRDIPELIMGVDVPITCAPLRPSQPAPDPDPATATWTEWQSTYKSASTVKPTYIPAMNSDTRSQPDREQRVKDWTQDASRANQARGTATSHASSSTTTVHPPTASPDTTARIPIRWGRASHAITMDPNANGENLLHQIQRKFKKCTQDLEDFQLRLSTERDTDNPNADQATISLDVKYLGVDLQAAVAWMVEYDLMSSAMYGTIEHIDAG